MRIRAQRFKDKFLSQCQNKHMSEIGGSTAAQASAAKRERGECLASPMSFLYVPVAQQCSDFLSQFGSLKYRAMVSLEIS